MGSSGGPRLEPHGARLLAQGRQVQVARLHGARERPGAHDGLEGVEYLDKVICIDQSPIGRTPRSNPAT